MTTENKRLVIYVPPAEIAALEAISQTQGGRSLTSIVREFITEGLSKRNGSAASGEGERSRAVNKKGH